MRKLMTAAVLFAALASTAYAQSSGGISAGAGGGASSLTAFKAATTHRVANTTVTADPELAVVVAAKPYKFHAVLFIHAVVGGFNFQVNGSAVASTVTLNPVLVTTTSTIIDLDQITAMGQNVNDRNQPGPFDGAIEIQGVVVFTTGGTFYLGWAQTNLDGNASDLKVGSNLLLTPM